MWIYSDYSQIIGEVKQRNRLLKAINEIKDIAMENCSKDTPPETIHQFELIVRTCNDALKSISSS